MFSLNDNISLSFVLVEFDECSISFLFIYKSFELSNVKYVLKNTWYFWNNIRMKLSQGIPLNTFSASMSSTPKHQLPFGIFNSVFPEKIKSTSSSYYFVSRCPTLMGRITQEAPLIEMPPRERDNDRGVTRLWRFRRG